MPRPGLIYFKRLGKIQCYFLISNNNQGSYGKFAQVSLWILMNHFNNYNSQVESRWRKVTLSWKQMLYQILGNEHDQSKYFQEKGTGNLAPTMLYYVVRNNRSGKRIKKYIKTPKQNRTASINANNSFSCNLKTSLQ